MARRPWRGSSPGAPGRRDAGTLNEEPGSPSAEPVNGPDRHDAPPEKSSPQVSRSDVSRTEIIADLIVSLFHKLLSVPGVVPDHASSKDATLLPPPHQNAVPRSQIIDRALPTSRPILVSATAMERLFPRPAAPPRGGRVPTRSSMMPSLPAASTSRTALLGPVLTSRRGFGNCSKTSAGNRFRAGSGPAVEPGPPSPPANSDDGSACHTARSRCARYAPEHQFENLPRESVSGG
jgi:hypothetical protein